MFLVFYITIFYFIVITAVNILPITILFLYITILKLEFLYQLIRAVRPPESRLLSSK